MFQYLACPACTLERLSPRPTIERIGGYYPQGYVPHTGSATFDLQDKVKRLVYEVFWAPEDEVRTGIRPCRGLLRLVFAPLRYRTILAFRPPTTRRVFEFGAAKATDLLAFRAAGWSVEGCEPSGAACELAAAQGIPLQNTTAENAVLADGAYSAILFNNVFEHVHDPLAVLQKCHRALGSDGTLMLIVPNHASWNALLFGGAWPGYDAPRHIWGWTPRSIRRILGEAGFEIEYIHHQATGSWLWRSMLDMRHSPLQPNAARRWLSRNASPAFVPISAVAALCKGGDFIRVLGRKRATARPTAGHLEGGR